ncbi:PKD domain-containing protein [Salisaeta longa]|uniref:PKD domain-containing protein n=1 Tax=Salisaeta longa TaxID=503170 RepID=UPI0003B46150|nr:PKD domain-containing protein [Salisaeta longa]
MRAFAHSVLFLLFLMLPAVATAQVIRAPHTAYARLGVGTSVSETDISTYAIEPYSFNGEMGYTLTQGLSVGLGGTFANYPKANVQNTEMLTLQAIGRWILFPRQSLSPYFNAGPNVTLGGDNPATGVTFGLGLDYVVTRHASVFVEATAYATMPDNAIDSRTDGRARFDGLGFWGVGVRSTLNAAPKPVDLLRIEGPDVIDRGTDGQFTVHTAPDVDRPVRYTWTMGDGTTAQGLATTHAYPLEGAYTVTVVAHNDGGTDRIHKTVTVREPTAPARILALSADTTTVRTGELVQFQAALHGTAPLSVQWNFGDGTEPVTERGLHHYNADRYIGTMRSETGQGYAFQSPGTYTVTLTAENALGQSTKDVVIEVGPAPQPALACGPLQQKVLFAFDSAQLTEASRDLLQQVAGALKVCPQTMLRVDGFADAVGSTDYNAALSQRRAQTVRTFLRSLGISDARFIVHGHGEVDAACPAEGRDRGCRPHRRVEAVLTVDEAPPLANDTNDRTSNIQW